MNLKTISSSNSKARIKLNSKLIWCIFALLISFSAAFAVKCSDGVRNKTITLPKLVSGTEKVEYMVNGEPQGSIDGKSQIKLSVGSKLTFAVKFQPEGYKNLRVRNVKIQSEKGSSLRLNRYDYDSENNFVLMRVLDTDLIDPNQTYISSDYIVKTDDAFSFEGVSEDTYSVKIKSENQDINLYDAIDLKYSDNSGNFIDADFSERENAFIINNLTHNSGVKVMVSLKNGYDKSKVFLDCNGKSTELNNDSKVFSLPQLSGDLYVSIAGLQKNTYSINFNKYNNAQFSYRISASGEDFKPELNTIVKYGDTVEFKFATATNDVMNDNVVTVNGVAIAPQNGIYKIENVSSDCNISVAPKANALYPVSIANGEARIKLCDISGNDIKQITAKQNSDVDFKIIPDDAYSHGLISADIYAVPNSKLSNGTYDVTQNPDEAKSFLISPSGNNLYSIKNISEPTTIILNNIQKNTYTVTLPENIIGAHASVQTNENVQKITENKFKVTHGSDLSITVSAEPGYDISDLTVSDVDNSLKVTKSGNTYTYKNVTGDKYLIINGASQSDCNVSFDSNKIIATNEIGSAWNGNSSTIKYKDGTLKFKVKAAEGCSVSESGISLNIKSGNGKLEKLSDEDNLYFLSDVTGDIVIGSSGIASSDVTISLKSNDDDIQFTDPNDESIILPEDNTVAYGTDLNFKVVSKSGRSVDNAQILSSSANSLIPDNSSSNTYSLRALRSGSVLTNTENGNKKQGDFVTLAENVHFTQSSEGKAVSSLRPEIVELDKNLPSSLNDCIVVFSKDPEACECLNAYTDAADENDGQGNITKTSKLKIPSLETASGSALEQNYLNAKVGLTTSVDFSGKIVGISLNLRSEELTAKINGNYLIRNISAGIPATDTYGILQEKEEASYNDEKTHDDKKVLQYLEDCYCHVFSNFYENVELKNNLGMDADHINSGVKLENLENINGTENTGYNIKIYNTDGGITPTSDFENKFRTQTCRFKVRLTNQKAKFADGVTAPITLGEGAHAKLTQEVKQDEDGGYYVDCTLIASAFDENIELNWSENSTIEKQSYKTTFISDGTIFQDKRETPINTEYTDYSEGMIFYTLPKDGYSLEDALKIQAGYYTEHIDLSKIRVDSSDTNNYDGQWIKLGQLNLFIRGTKQSDRIKYEIAPKGNISEYIAKKETAHQGDESGYIQYELKQDGESTGMSSDLQIKSTRTARKVAVTFGYTEGIKYTQPNSTSEMVSPKEVDYGESVPFQIKPEDGYDISSIQVTASTSTNTNILTLTNGMYILTNITQDTTINVTGVKKNNVSLSFTQYDGMSYKNTSGEEYLPHQKVPYNEEIVFQLDVAPRYSGNADNIKVYVNGEEFKTGTSSDEPHKEQNFYIIPASYVKDDLKITLGNININEYEVKMESATGIKYYDQYGTTELSGDRLTPKVQYGNSFSFQLRPDEGYETSSIEVTAKSALGVATTLVPSNGVYTIENISSDYTVAVKGVSHVKHNVEFRTVTGVACLDAYGKTLPSTVTVSHGDDFSFYLSFDTAYSKAADTADVVIKGSNNKIPHDSSGKYTISDIQEDKIIEIINVTKNAYKATFVPAEGVIYRTAKGKEFSGSLDVEYGESLYFKISLMDAYDQSTPSVKMNGSKSLVENSGSYVLENISDDVEVTVENVTKNPEEVTIDNINNVPNPVTTENDVNAVVEATKAFNSLSDDDKKLVTNKQALEHAQGEAADINHSSNGLTISGLDWNIKLIVTPLSDNEDEMKAFAEKVERRSVLSLYKVQLVDLLTGEEYDIPYGKEAQITMPCPDLTGYKNVTVAHENTIENMEYLDPNILDNVAKFSTTSVGKFGIAAKEIPNYSEDVSDMSISVGDLVENEDELKTLLGENLSSQLGHLIDLEDNNLGNGSDSSNNSSSESNELTDSLDSLWNNMSDGTASLANSVYGWALDNELLAVLGILFIGSLLIGLILLASRKKKKKEK